MLFIVEQLYILLTVVELWLTLFLVTPVP